MEQYSNIAGFLVSWMMGYNMFEGFNGRLSSLFTFSWFSSNIIATIINWLYFALQESGHFRQTRIGHKKLLEVAGSVSHLPMQQDATLRRSFLLSFFYRLCYGGLGLPQAGT